MRCNRSPSWTTSACRRVSFGKPLRIRAMGFGPSLCQTSLGVSTKKSIAEQHLPTADRGVHRSIRSPTLSARTHGRGLQFGERFLWVTLVGMELHIRESLASFARDAINRLRRRNDRGHVRLLMWITSLLMMCSSGHNLHRSSSDLFDRNVACLRMEQNRPTAGVEYILHRWPGAGRLQYRKVRPFRA